jgi:glycerol-3-phosphate dehydrogenase (NAD(P)+)
MIIGVITGTPLGEALAARLREDGREVITEVGEMSRTQLVVVDARPGELHQRARALGEKLDGSQLLAHTVRGLVAGVGAATESGKPLGTASGQLARLASLSSPIDVLREETPCPRVGVLGGPLSSTDLAAGRPTAAVVASRHPEVVVEFASALSTPKLRVYRGHDPLGVELASTLPELVAMGWGVASALGFSATTRAVLLVRAVRELGRLIDALGGDATTASGLAGLGDMLVRGSDHQGPAFQYGAALAGAGRPAAPPELAAVVDNARAIRQLARDHKVAVHIFHGLADLLDGQLAAGDLVARLMTLPVLDD